MYNVTHFYQVPEDPIGTFIWFHGCVHDASAGWPYDPDECPECLGLPEEALARGYAVLAVESKNRERKERCFNYSPDETISDAYQVPKIIERFVRVKRLQDKPIYTAGVSSGASFAVKIPKGFYSSENEVKIHGAISEANAIPIESWGLLDTRGQLRYPGFPPNDPFSRVQMLENIDVFRSVGIPSDWVSVWQRSINESFFFERSPTITMPQSAAIVKALKAMGVVDEDGNLMGDPRIDAPNRTSVMHKWNFKLVQRVPWLNLNRNKPPMLTALSDRGAIFEEMNVAFARHEIIADYLVPCLAWLEKEGKADLKELGRQLGVKRLRDLTMDRIYPSPPPAPRPPPSPTKKGSEDADDDGNAVEGANG
ncbi:hypothetical protein CHLNCDRAFT_141972 [Chlorella variabilis]|uniref:Uncharacterized protein n=1 Tax=Chlorella variabilis TaxID=554065 RepID=E1Z7F7_CHLVA|nr:hypothetical protein CHLNCDRAFT_141972 [Chlorella variabilis]EFN58162.1 hypothetical protein CHLNCDRAFT_141972 [Chlorella variabilis]|eukprot:XP_005850264.1 hypothetical protein CHLNCDRAFT_141972 [Chlorella variabilis]